MARSFHKRCEAAATILMISPKENITFVKRQDIPHAFSWQVGISQEGADKERTHPATTLYRGDI